MEGKMNINKISRNDLISRVEGIGEEMADAIIRYRDEHKGFKSVEEFKDVPGISDIRARKLREQSEL